jgi:hypothetical protein
MKYWVTVPRKRIIGVGRPAVSDVKGFDDEASALVFLAEQEAAGKHLGQPTPARFVVRS